MQEEDNQPNNQAFEQFKPNIPDWVKTIPGISRSLYEKAVCGDATAQYLIGKKIELSVKRAVPGSKEFDCVVGLYEASDKNGESRAGERIVKIWAANKKYKQELENSSSNSLANKIKYGASVALNYLSSALSHPVTTIASRVATIAISSAVPPVLAGVIVAQVISIGFRTAQVYRKKRLESRERLLEKLDEIVSRRAVAEKALNILVTKKVVAFQYEKKARKDAKISLVKTAAINFAEDIVPIVSDMVATHGLSLGPRIVQILNDTWISIGSGVGSEIGSGVFGSRKLEIAENDTRREYIQYLATKHGVPDYGMDTEKLRQFVEQQYRETKALCHMVEHKEAYSSTLHQIRTKEVSSKDEQLLQPKSRFKILMSSFREAMIGSESDYIYIKKAWIGIKFYMEKAWRGVQLFVSKAKGTDILEVTRKDTILQDNKLEQSVELVNFSIKEQHNRVVTATLTKLLARHPRLSNNAIISAPATPALTVEQTDSVRK